MNRSDVKIIQVSSEPLVKRELDSFESLSKLGYRYIRIINPRYSEYPPTDNVFDGKKEWIVGITKPNPDEWGLTSGHYGAWQGHLSAILASFISISFVLLNPPIVSLTTLVSETNSSIIANSTSCFANSVLSANLS